MAKVMVIEFLILFMFWSSLSNSTYALTAVSHAKPGCEEKCGNVSIPYPFGFGIRKNCFLKPWYEIECKNTSGSTGPRPFLKKVNLEVLQILLPDGKYPRPTGFIRVNNPVLSSGCQGSRPAGKAVNLTGSTFVFSREKNWFTVVGCDSKATLLLPSFIGGKCRNQFVGVDKCVASCSKNKSSSTCCRSAIPSSLNAFNVSFNRTGSRGNCTYAFLADKDWLRMNSCVSGLDHVPAVLEWSVLDFHIPGLLNNERSIGFYFSCGTDLNQNGNQTLRCYCDRGYEGNPYLNMSCSDINECEDGSFKCNGTTTCQNQRGSYICVPKKSQIIMVIKGLGYGLGLLTLAAGICWSYKLIKKRNKVKRKKRLFKRNGGLVLRQQLASSQGNVDQTNVFTSKELSRATDRFNINRVLGQGGQGTVYKGMLQDGRIVAVKKSRIENESEIEPFINEVVILSQINHRNIVKLLGCCLETEVPLLVYEFVPNGNLSQYLHDEFQVSWKMRLQIATQVAGALSYLHSSASIPIYHRDIKSSNILLDDKFRAKIADFGTSRSVNIDQTHLTTLVHGTCGYLDPEYFQSSQYTDKSDVYSFGVVLVELLTGQRAISTARSREGRSLATYFIITMERNRLFDILDAEVVEQGERGEIVAVAKVAKRCLNLNGRNRPTMREVTKELERIGSPEKGFSGDGSCEEVELLPWDAVSSSNTGLGCFSPRSLVDQPRSLVGQPLLRLPTQTW